MKRIFLTAFLSFSYGFLTLADNVVVDISGNTFVPSIIMVEVGDMVTWNNDGGFHNVVANDASFTSGPPSSMLWTFDHTFTEIGEFPYFCEVHVGQGMTGTVIVVDNMVELIGSSFSPSFLMVEPGTTVGWINNGGFHNVRAEDESFTSGSPSSSIWTFSHLFNSAGLNPYYCQIHGQPGGVGMSGEILVCLMDIGPLIEAWPTTSVLSLINVECPP